MKKRINFTFLLTAIIAVSFFSCKKGCINKTTNYQISESDRNSAIPYKTDFDKLFFISTVTKDTFVFSGYSWGNSILKIVSALPPDCSQTINMDNWVKQYKDTIHGEFIVIGYSRYDFAGSPYIKISTQYNQYIASPSKYCPDSLTIQSHTYYNVNSFSNDYQPEKNTGHYCFYNRTNGILKIEMRQDFGTLELWKVE